MLPVFIECRDRSCLVVGGGAVAHSKIRLLLDQGARVTVISPDVVSDLEDLVSTNPHLKWKKKRLQEEDLDDHYSLVFACTGQAEVQEHISSWCRAKGILLNAADEPDRCDFFLGANCVQGPVTIAVSTSGHSPRLAQILRDRIARQKWFQGSGHLTTLIGQLRQKVVNLPMCTKVRFWRQNLDEGLLDEWVQAPLNVEKHLTHVVEKLQRSKP